MPLPAMTPFGAKEIFRYVKIVQPQIIDLAYRARNSSRLKAVLTKKDADQTAWARTQTRSDSNVSSENDLRFDYFSHLTIKSVPEDKLPSRAVVLDPKAFAAGNFASNRECRTDVENCLASLLAYKILDDEAHSAVVARLLSFIEAFPELHNAEEERGYPAAVLKKMNFKVAPPAPRQAKGPPTAVVEEAQDMRKLAQNIKTLWTARNELLGSERAKLDEQYRKVMRVEPVVESAPAAKGRSSKKKPTTAAAGKAAVNQERARLAARVMERRSALVSLGNEMSAKPAALTLGSVLDMLPKELSAGAKNGTKLVAIQKETKELLEKRGLQGGTFADTYKQVVDKNDSLGVKLEDAPATDCFRENPVLTFGDSVRLLGHADLIRVDETFVKYTAGEISYIENILPGEIKKREVKSTKYFEQVVETMTQEEKESSTESNISTKQDLGSQVATELSTRLNSEMSASANGSGGGSIGVVDFKGGASANASLGLGVDSSLKSENTSNFSQEIISKAVEKTKSTTTERRMTRTYSLYESLNSHEINNAQGNDIRARNGIYCFLDRHVCLTESVYGKRLFLMANLHLPGRNLLCERELRLSMGMSDLGPRPEFTISVDDIQPSTYKEFVTKYKASNISPPPAAVHTISKTYKTDNTNVNAEKGGMDLKKVAGALTPFFEQYKRFLVTENIKLPEGYEVQEVTAAFNHGRNGVSIPASLPLKLAGATMGAGVTAAAAAASGYFAVLLLPTAVWQFEYAASPLLHYNSDSSNVSLCVGTETLQSPYFFFDPTFLLEEVIHAFSTFLQNSPDLLTQIKTKTDALVDTLAANAGQIPEKIRLLVQDAIDTVIQNVQNALNGINIFGNLKKGLEATFGALSGAIVDVGGLTTELQSLFTAFKDFVSGVIQVLRDGLASALTGLFSAIAVISQESQTKTFANVAGITGELPVSINAVAINPGITVNLVASLSRTDEALDRWRLETFNSLYQAYVQQLADYESKAMMSDKADRITKPPQMLRREEAVSLKELILYALNNYHGPEPGNQYDLEKINFFENALDWDNMSFRVFNYGPNAKQVDMDKRGVFAAVDDRRRAFLTSAWAQVVLPVQADPRLEQQVGQYFDDGTFDLENGFSNDELAALYQDLITGRSRIANAPEPKPIGHEVLPTEFIIIKEDLPTNPDTPCGLP